MTHFPIVKMPKRYRTAYDSKRSTRRRTGIFSKSKRRKAPARRRTRFARSVMNVVKRRAETKEVMLHICNNQTVQHNTVTNLYANAFYSKIGTTAEQVLLAGAGNRIGSKLFCKGLKVSLMIEAQQYRPQTQWWFYLIKYKSDPTNLIDTKPKMFEGVSTTIPCDYLDTDQVHVLACKKFVLRMPNAGTANTLNTAVATNPEDGPDGTYWQVDGANSNETLFTTPQKLTKFYIPVNKTINYQDWTGGDPTVPSSFRYQWVCIAYDNFGTLTGGGSLPAHANYPVGHVTMTTKMVFTDV